MLQGMFQINQESQGLYNMLQCMFHMNFQSGLCVNCEVVFMVQFDRQQSLGSHSVSVYSQCSSDRQTTAGRTKVNEVADRARMG